MNTIMNLGGPTDNENTETAQVEGTQGTQEIPAEKPVKKSRAKRAAKKAAKAVERAVSTAWNLGKTMTLHGCKVSGVTIPKELVERHGGKGGVYRSYWAAWQAAEMGGSRGRHIKMRGQLKKQLAEGGKPYHTLTRPDGKKVTFTLVESSPES